MPTLERVDRTFANTAPRLVSVERTIDATPSEIWSVLVDNPGWVDWFPGMKRCDTTSSMATGVGATRTVKVGALVADEEFIVWDAPRAWGFIVTKSNIPIATKMLELVELEPASDGTLIRYTGAFEPHMFTKLVFGLVEKNVRAVWSGGFAGLADHLAKQS